MVLVDGNVGAVGKCTTGGGGGWACDGGGEAAAGRVWETSGGAGIWGICGVTILLRSAGACCWSTHVKNCAAGKIGLPYSIALVSWRVV